MDGTGRIDELEQKFTENPRRYFAPLANEYRKAGNPQRAMEICRAHLGQLPGHMSGQIVYGQALFECGEYDRARTVFENALAMDRENLIVLRHLGDLALREGDTTQAKQWYTRLLEVDPKDTAVIALVNEVDAASDAVADNEAPPAHTPEEDEIMAEELGFPLSPPQAFVTETMAELYLAQGFKDRALETYRQLASMKPDDEQIQARVAELELPPPEPEAVSARRLSVREFFAALGARRPPSRAGTDEDRNAATALAGAFSGASGSSWGVSHETAAPTRASAAKESEEDMARFRAWLDGLTGG